ncbi:hypothetical protein Ngar_c09570 [Candidatus Nitrososphaera gargensis Ga9.2]|uniref:Uncharacterized protein n=1 Tax=Nitrososphaera gargensis (strain Ga9.2) TaxID=1237085 RepID=K0IMH4_NITGG|nr:helix-turn-helix domain-containing protein [Candidatus Nitrososphaera gargensis]AFU57899.1 hypothetical protein Ngar_c09570 [Candidatus Nitrososphaera gargensis Ga9.2]
MPERVPDVTKLKILRLWLAGESRDNIARKTGVGTGTVSNVISEWRTSYANYNIDALRELGIAMKNAGITPKEAADAARVFNMLTKNNVKLDDLDFFISDAYKTCSNTGLPTERLVDLLNQFFALSSSLNIPAEELPIQLAKLKNEVEGLKKSKIELEQELSNKETTLLDLQQFVTAREMLREHLGDDNGNFSIVEHLPKLANMLRNAKEMQYNPSKIISKISKIKSLQEQESALRVAIENKERRYRYFARESQRLENKVNSLSQTVRFYKELKAMGFGLRQLRLLHSILEELVNDSIIIDSIFAVETPGKAAVTKFFRDLEEMYPQLLDYQERIRQLKVDAENYNYLAENAKKRYADRKDLIDTVEILTNRKGFNRDDIIYLQSIIMKHNIGRANKKKFAADLDKYGSIEDAIADSSFQLGELQKQEISLQARIKQLKSDVEDLEAKRIAISESLKDGALFIQALLAQAEAEAKQGISSVVQEARQGMQTAKELLDECKKISYETIATVSKLNLEVSKQFESISRLEGFKDLAEVISIASAIDTNEKLGASSRELLPKLDLHTIGVLSMLISAYEKYGPEAKVITEPFSRVRALLATFVATSHIGAKQM